MSGDTAARYRYPNPKTTPAVDAHLATYDASSTVSGIDDRSIIAILAAIMHRA